jgi:pilus assembly protein Flp/PilA
MVSMLAFVTGVKNKFESEKGATAVEYSLLVALIAAAIVAAVNLLAGDVIRAFNLVTTAIPGGNP